MAKSIQKRGKQMKDKTSRAEALRKKGLAEMVNGELERRASERMPTSFSGA